MTTIFSITFLLLLYARHCKSGNAVVVAGFNGNPPNLRGGLASHARKNSGIDRAVIESLPIFRFGSLRGEKDGLECAVCLTKFEPTEVLRLLPKCEHAFHVECVDTWLDAHSTCPLCRYRVDPEDILLVENVKILHQNLPIIPPSQENSDVDFVAIESGRIGSEFRPVSGRHSSAGEKGRPSESDRESGYYYPTTSFRRSMDSATWRKKSESIAVGCFDRPRKDGILLTEDRTSLERRYEHRIIVSPRSSGLHQRWSDVQPCDLLYLTAEMIITDSRRFISESRSKPSVSRQQQENMQVPLHWNNRYGGHHVSNNISTSCKDEDRSVAGVGGRSVINSRSVSEITGLSRFSNRGSSNNRYRQQEHEHQQRHAGVVSRWLAWISSQSRPSVR
ncbi:putative Ring finger protein [Quillaja saponaria]|nr:putative Ring finger protein [Quillaja saponaria]